MLADDLAADGLPDAGAWKMFAVMQPLKDSNGVDGIETGIMMDVAASACAVPN